MTLRASVLLLLGLAGCDRLGFTPIDLPAAEPTDAEPTESTDAPDPQGDSDTDVVWPDTNPSDDTDPVPTTPPNLQGLDPAYGTDAGDTRVVLTGAHLGPGTTVRFDGRDATIVSAAAGEVVVRTPDHPAGAGPVDVELETPAGSDTLTDGFRYWTDGTGATGALSTLHRVRYDGGYWTAPPDPYTRAVVSWFEPVQLSYWEFFTPTMGTCAVNHVWPGTLDNYEPGATRLVLRAGSDTLRLTEDVDIPGLYASEIEPISAAQATQTFDLEPVQGDAAWPGFGLAPLVTPIGRFDVTSPDIRAASSPDVGQFLDIEWTGSGGDYVVISLTHLTQDGGQLATVQRISCAVPDTGSFRIPASAWPRWKERALDYLVLEVGRVVETATPQPHDGSDMKSASIYWVIGAADML